VELKEWCSTEVMQYFSVQESLETTVLLRNFCKELLCNLKTAVLLRNYCAVRKRINFGVEGVVFH
jgi:hypothetical protein